MSWAMVVVVAGDDAEQAREALTGALGAWQTGAEGLLRFAYVSDPVPVPDRDEYALTGTLIEALSPGACECYGAGACQRCFDDARRLIGCRVRDDLNDREFTVASVGSKDGYPTVSGGEDEPYWLMVGPDASVYEPGPEVTGFGEAEPRYLPGEWVKLG